MKCLATPFLQIDIEYLFDARIALAYSANLNLEMSSKDFTYEKTANISVYFLLFISK